MGSRKITVMDVQVLGGWSWIDDKNPSTIAYLLCFSIRFCRWIPLIASTMAWEVSCKVLASLWCQWLSPFGVRSLKKKRVHVIVVQLFWCFSWFEAFLRIHSLYHSFWERIGATNIVKMASRIISAYGKSGRASKLEGRLREVWFSVPQGARYQTLTASVQRTWEWHIGQEQEAEWWMSVANSESVRRQAKVLIVSSPLLKARSW